MIIRDATIPQTLQKLGGLIFGSPYVYTHVYIQRVFDAELSMREHFSRLSQTYFYRAFTTPLYSNAVLVEVFLPRHWRFCLARGSASEAQSQAT